jgi:branched-chain amino acid transport system substrate-binding protein
MNRIVLTALVVLLLAACGGENPGGGATDSVRGVTDTEILIGSHNDLSGPLAYIGVGAINGARLRFEEANAGGGVHGRTIRLIVEDSQYQVPRAIQAANKLVNRDGVFAMILGMGTPMNNAIIPMLEQNGVPNLFPISGARSMIEPFRRMQFNARGIYYDEIRAGVRYFVEQAEQPVPCIVYQDTDFGQEIYDGAVEQLAELGLQAAAISSHKPADTEFTSAILRLKNAGCNLVMLGTVHKDTMLLFEAARKLALDDVQWVGTNAAYNQAVADMESGASEGYAVFTHITVVYRDDPQLDPLVAQWWDRYVERFGSDPDYFALEGYRNADLLVKALENAGRDLGTESLIAGMESIAEYTDLFGYSLGFGPRDHKGVESSALSIVRNGRWITAEESVTY